MEALPSALQSLAIGAIVYFALIAVLRVSGKRTLSKWNAFDLVVTISLGSVLASAVTSERVGALEGIAALALLVGLQFVVSWSVLRFEKLQHWTKARPRLLLRDGQFDDRALKEERVTRNEVLAAIRAAGHGEVEQVGAVVLETDGSVSVIGHPGRASALEDVRGRAEKARSECARASGGDPAARG